MSFARWLLLTVAELITAYTESQLGMDQFFNFNFKKTQPNEAFTPPTQPITNTWHGEFTTKICRHISTKQQSLTT